MSVLLKRRAGRQTIEVEVYAGRNAQGGPTYETAVEIEATVIEEDVLVLQADGSQVRSTRTVYVDGAEDTLPGHRDRLTIDEVEFVVLERKEVKRLNAAGTVDHIRLRCREE